MRESMVRNESVLEVKGSLLKEIIPFFGSKNRIYLAIMFQIVLAQDGRVYTDD